MHVLTRRRPGILLAAAALAAAPSASVLLAGAGSAHAASVPSLTLDLRDRATGGKDAYVSRVGDIVFLDLYAIVQGADNDPTNDGISLLVNGFQSSPGGILGDLQGVVAPAPYNAIGASVGVQNDLDGDGDFDIGPMNVNDTNPEWFYAARAVPAAGYIQPPGGFHIGQVRFNVTLLSDQPTTVNAFKRPAVEGSIGWLDGGGSGLIGHRFDLDRIFTGLDVTIRRQVIVDPPGSQYLTGTVATHVTASGPVRVTPNATLTLTLGADVTATGSLEPGNGTLNLDVNDATSGNAGGTLVVTGTRIGTTADGVFTQSAGSSRLGNVTVGAAAGRSGTLNLAGGTLNAYAMTLGAGATGVGTLDVTDGSATVTGLRVRNGSAARLAGGGVSVAGNATVNGGATLTQAGGVHSISQTLQLGDGSSLTPALFRVQGGMLDASVAVVGTVDFQGAGVGRIEQTGGTFRPASLWIGGPDPDNRSTYDLSAGRFQPGSLILTSHAVITQTGGELAGGLIVLISGASAPTQYHLAGGVIDRRHLRNNRTNPDPLPGSGQTGGFVQSGGQFNVGVYAIDTEATSQHLGGAATVRESLGLDGKIDFGNTPFALTIGSNAFAAFQGGQILNAASATFTGAAGSLMSFASAAQLQSVGTVQTQGLIHIAGQPLAIAQNQSIGGSGTIEGNVTNNGTIQPGSSPGAINVVGNFTQADTGKLVMEIAGTAADEFDALTISGSAALDGVLDLSLLEGFVPQASDTFKILATAGLSGAFDNAAVMIDFPNGRFDIHYAPTGVTLTNFQPIPEPAAIALIGGAAAAMCLRRHRRRHSIN